MIIDLWSNMFCGTVISDLTLFNVGYLQYEGRTSKLKVEDGTTAHSKA